MVHLRSVLTQFFIAVSRRLIIKNPLQSAKLVVLLQCVSRGCSLFEMTNFAGVPLRGSTQRYQRAWAWDSEYQDSEY